MKTIHELLENLQYDVLTGSVEKEVTKVIYDSRKIEEGCLFICIKGANFNGHDFAKEACEKKGVEFYYPSPIYCTDNAAMIGVAGYYDYLAGKRDGLDLNATPNLKLGER